MLMFFQKIYKRFMVKFPIQKQSIMVQGFDLNFQESLASAHY